MQRVRAGGPTFHLTQHVKQGLKDMLVTVPAQHGSERSEPSPKQPARHLLELAMHVLATTKRGPKWVPSRGGVDGRTAQSRLSTARRLKASGHSPRWKPFQFMPAAGERATGTASIAPTRTK